MLSGVRMLARFGSAAALAALLIVPAVAFAQADATAPAAAGATGASGSTGSTGSTKKKTTSKKKSSRKKKAPVKQQTDIDEETRKALEAAQPPVAPEPTVVHVQAPVPVVPPPVQEAPQAEGYNGPPDDDPPTLNHVAVTKGTRGKSIVITAHAVDPSGIFGPVLYLKKKGMPNTDFVALRMNAVKGGKPGDYQVEISPTLMSVDALEYYVEVYDQAGNGPVRAGSPEQPFTIVVEEEKKPEEPKKVVIDTHGAPPAITHTAVTQAVKNTSIEINARLVGDTGVGKALVMFRHVGEKEYRTLPMGLLGGDDYTATIPAGQATGDIEYYLEATDKFGNGPARSGAPNVPYVVKVSEPVVNQPVTSAGQPVHQGPRIVKAPFSPNPGRALGWLAMAGFIGGAAFAGGEALAASQNNNAYTHTYTYEGRNDTSLLNKANADGNRAKTAAIVAGASLVVGIVLLIVFPEHPDTMVVGGGDGQLEVKF